MTDGDRCSDAQRRHQLGSVVGAGGYLDTVFRAVYSLMHAAAACLHIDAAEYGKPNVEYLGRAARTAISP